MKKAARIVITVVAFVVAVFFLGLLRIAYQSVGRPEGGIYGVLSFLIIFGIPYLAWWVTGRIGPKQPPEKQ